MTAATLDRAENSASNSPHKGGEAIRRRALRLQQADIDFVPNSEFASGALSDSALVAATLDSAKERSQAPADLPAHLRRMCESDLLTPQQERALFREMNYLKFQAHSLRSQLDLEQLDPHVVACIESLLAQAQTIRDHLDQSQHAARHVDRQEVRHATAFF